MDGRLKENPGRGVGMSAVGGSRRELRRRLFQAQPAGSDAGGPRKMDGSRTAAYAAEAHPGRHPALATRIPSDSLGVWGVSTVAVIANLLLIGLVLEARPERSIGRLMTPARAASEKAGRFDRSVSVLLRHVTPAATVIPVGSSRGLPSIDLVDWIGQMSLLSAAAVAISIRQMRRHRLDDFQGRYRAWGWLAVLAVASAATRQLPVDRLVGALASDASGLTLGPDGVGWWLATALVLWLIAGTWCLAPLARRVAVTIWFTVSGLAWMAGATIDCLLRSGSPLDEGMGLLGSLAVVTGDTALLIAMIWAFRTVLREVTGEVVAIPQKPNGLSSAVGMTGHSTPSRRATPLTAEDGEHRHDVREPSADSYHCRVVDDSKDPIQFNADDDEADALDDDGRGQSGRKLSKAERRRLRKQARLDRAA